MNNIGRGLVRVWRLSRAHPEATLETHDRAHHDLDRHLCHPHPQRPRQLRALVERFETEEELERPPHHVGRRRGHKVEPSDDVLDPERLELKHKERDVGPADLGHRRPSEGGEHRGREQAEGLSCGRAARSTGTLIEGGDRTGDDRQEVGAGVRIERSKLAQREKPR